LTLVEVPDNLSLVHIPLGTIYLHHISANTKRYATREKQQFLAKQAKTLFLRACEASPSSTSWLGAGRACIVLEELDQAENALSEANILNNRDGQVWASLAQLSLLQNRTYEASQAITQAFKHDVRDVDVLVELGAQFSKIGNVKSSVDCLELALEQLFVQQQELNNTKATFEMNKDLQTRQRQKQYEIENFIYQLKEDGSESEAEPKVKEIEVVEDEAIGARIVSVKEMLDAALTDLPDLRSMAGNPICGI
jgi:tetratricopeptide (TPR) repeat protein